MTSRTLFSFPTQMIPKDELGEEGNGVSYPGSLIGKGGGLQIILQRTLGKESSAVFGLPGIAFGGCLMGLPAQMGHY